MATSAQNLALELPVSVTRALMIARYLPLYIRDPGLRRQWRAEDAVQRAAQRLQPPRIPFGRPSRGASERAVEIPWVLSEIPVTAGGRILDAGSAFAPQCYRRVLHCLAQRAELHLVDIVPTSLPPATTHVADLRALPFPSGQFHVAISISTIEHIGMDNREYGIQDIPSPGLGGDVAALRELARVTARDGRVLITVPAGRAMTFNSFRQYSPETWAETVAAADLRTHAVSYLAHDPESGWCPVEPDAVQNYSYGNGAPNAAAVICAILAQGDVE